MGLTLEFYEGDASALKAAFDNVDYDVLDDTAIVKRRADLSLHITPNDLNLLSLQVGRFADIEPIELRPHLDVLVDEQDRGLLAVAPKWIAYVSALASSRVDDVVQGWFEAMQQEHDDLGIKVTPEARQAVAEFVALCESAHEDATPVTHGWML